MIRQIRGIVVDRAPEGATLDVSGFGVFVHMAASEALPAEGEATLLTYLSLTQNGIELYGFTNGADRAFFELLLCVPGVGPKTALGILRRAPREALAGAIGSRDLDYLTRVIGLGKKAAEKLIVELAEKVGDGAKPDADDGDVFDTLVALGYTEREARTAVGAIAKDIVGKDARLKAALSNGR